MADWSLVGVDLRLLRYFVATADAGSATQAATTLHVTQPVLSRQLRQLEQQLGLRLFERDGRRLRLTHAAEEFLPRARALLRDAEGLEQAAHALGSGQVQQLHLAVPTTTLSDVLAPFIATLGPSDPVPILRSLDPGGAGAAIAAGADLAIVHRPPPTTVSSRALAVLPVLAHVRADDPWAGRGRIDVAELVGRPLILQPVEFRPRALLDAAADAAGLAYGEVLEVANAQVGQALAAAGRGIAVLSDDPRFGLVPLRIGTDRGTLRLSLYAAWDPHHHAAPLLATFADRLAAYCADTYGPEVIPRSGGGVRRPRSS